MQQHIMTSGSEGHAEVMCMPRMATLSMTVQRGQTRVTCPLCQKSLVVDMQEETVQPAYFGESPV